MELKEDYNKLKESLVLTSEIIHIYVNDRIKNEKLFKVIFNYMKKTLFMKMKTIY